MDAAIEGAVLRLRPIMMTMLVATFGLVPAALSHEIGSDSQRPFAIVIVGGLMVGLVMSIFILPTLYVWVAGDNDVLPVPELRRLRVANRHDAGSRTASKRSASSPPSTPRRLMTPRLPRGRCFWPGFRSWKSR